MTEEQLDKLVTYVTGKSGQPPPHPAWLVAMQPLVAFVDEAALDSAITTDDDAATAKRIAELEAELADLKGR